MVGSGKKKIKRPEIERYIPPALRKEPNHRFEEAMEYGKENHASELAKRQTYFSKYRDSSWRSTSTVSGKVRYNSSSSSNPRNTSDESYKDYDSSDFEECCGVPAEVMRDEEANMGTNETSSNDHWNIELRGKPTTNNQDSEAENYQTNTEIPNRILMEHEHDSDLEPHTNQLQDFKSTETKRDRRLFYSSDEKSISSIEALIDNQMKKEGRVLTSTPNSDIDEPKVIDAAKYDPEEENEQETTLLSESETTINTNRNKLDYNFEIYRDPSSVTNQSTDDFTKIFGTNYIPPPVPRPAFTFQLPLIHRLPLRVSLPTMLSASVSSVSPVSSQKIHQSPEQLGNPRSLYPPCLQLYSSDPHPSFIPTKSLRKPTFTRSVLSPEPFLASNTPCRPSIPPIPPPKERINPPRPLQNVSNPPHFDQRGLNIQGLKSKEQEDPFYIPPPVPPPQHISAVQQIRNLNQLLNMQSRQISLISSVNKRVYDSKIWPQNT